MPKQNTIAWVVSTTEVYFLTGLDAGKQRSGLLSWSGSSWLTDGCLLPVPSYGRESELWSLPLLIWALIHL